MVDFVPFLIRNRFSVCWPRVTGFLKDLLQHKDTALLLELQVSAGEDYILSD
jgi:hypothetical protein